MENFHTLSILYLYQYLMVIIEKSWICEWDEIVIMNCLITIWIDNTNFYYLFIKIKMMPHFANLKV